VLSAARGKPAATRYRVERRFGDRAALIECRLLTGRTHQIRVHLAYIGHPIMGDETYATGFKTKATRLTPKARTALEALGRQALHAAVLGFTHPITGEVLRFESPPPADIQALITALRTKV
jgi:23S rRNA pseudouridine1911/1915/1917 synthase